MSSGASGLNGAGFGLSTGSEVNSRTVVELDLAVYTQLFIVYNSCTPCGMSRIQYLHSDQSVIYVYSHSHMYVLYVYLSSGAYCGGTVDSVEAVAAHNHRDSMVDKYWQRHYLQDETQVDESFEQGSEQFF